MDRTMLSFARRILSFPDEEVRKYKLLSRCLASHGYFWKDGTIRCIHEEDQPLDPVIFKEANNTCLPVHDCSKKNKNYLISVGALYLDDDFKNYESHRILSFMDSCNPWPRSLDKFALAASGFYYKGIDDVCTCAFCNLSVAQWELDDTPEGEHRRWKPDCPFINGKPVGNVTLSTETRGMEGRYNLQKQKIAYAESPKHEHMRKFYARNETFVNWQHGGDLTAFSKAGFFNNKDQLTCFYCDGTINYPVDDPWISHAAWFPTCDYLLSVKNHTFVRSIQVLVLRS